MPEDAAIQALLGSPGPEATLNRVVAEQEATFFTTRPPLSAAAARLRTRWNREGKALSKQFVDVVAKWDRGWTTLPDFHYPPRDPLHVYGPDRTGNGGDNFYALEWTFIDPFAGTGSFARADRRTGTIGAGHYSTSGWLRSFAGVGVRIVPKTGIGVLSARPYVNRSGNDLLQHRVFDPELGESRWAEALGRDHCPEHARRRRRLPDRCDPVAGCLAPGRVKSPERLRPRRYRRRGHGVDGRRARGLTIIGTGTAISKLPILYRNS